MAEERQQEQQFIVVWQTDRQAQDVDSVRRGTRQSVQPASSPVSAAGQHVAMTTDSMSP